MVPQDNLQTCGRTEQCRKTGPMRQDHNFRRTDEHGPGSERPLGPALRRGWSGNCPQCGGGPIFEGYLKVRERCPSCAEALFHHRADDMPAWATILIVGHIVGLGIFHSEMAYQPPVWVHWALWPALAIGLTMWLLPRIKGTIVALQWAKRMHGFDGEASG